MQTRTQPQATQHLHAPSKKISSLSVRVMFILGCLTAFTGGNGFAATYYISTSGNDGNSGTQGSPWRTIGKAASTLVAGDTAILTDGTYDEGPINFRNSGAPTRPITFMAQNKRQAILSSRLGCAPAIGINASYITIQDIKITESPNNSRCGSPTTNIPAAIRAWEQTVPNINGSLSTGNDHFTARGVYIDASAGFALGIKTNSDYALVENSEIHNSLEAFNSIGTIYRNNVLYGVDVFGSTITAKGGVRNIEIYNNVIHMNVSSGWNEGLVIGGTSGAQWDYEPSLGIECYNCVAFNNVVINETGTAKDLYIMAACQNCAFLNNVGISGSMAMRGGGGAERTSRNPTWKNNIIICGNGATLGSWSPSGTLTMDYNNFYNCSGAPSQAHPITGNPLFVNQNSDWHLQPSSPALGAGVVVTMTAFGGGAIDVTKDFAGITRTTPWSLGIYAGNSQSADTTPPPVVTGVRVQ